MIYSLKNKSIWRGALDNYEQDPLPETRELLKFDNVVLTTHSAFITDEDCTFIIDCCVDNVNEFFTRTKLNNMLIPDF
jgi:phosphoglycerate dehydrogenase-like enzyme